MITPVDKSLVQMLLANEIDVLIHGCHSQASFPIGLGNEIEVTFPEAKVAHVKHYYKNNKTGMLGEYSSHFYRTDRKFGVINLYCQVFPGPDLRESSLRAGLIKVFKDFGFLKRNGEPIRYGIPIIGQEWKSMTELEMVSHLFIVKDYFEGKGLKSAENLTIFLKT